MSVYHNIYNAKLQEVQKAVEAQNNRTHTTLWFTYISTVLNTFKWGNLPETILSWLPEEFLMYWGKLAFFKDDDGNFKMYPCYMQGELEENGTYSSYTIIAKNGKSWARKADEIVICYNNASQLPTIGFINELAEKSAFALRSVDVSLERAIVPKVITGSDEGQMNLISQMYDKNKNLEIFRTAYGEAFGENGIDVKSLFDNRENDVLALWDVYVRYRNLFYTTFGINNVEIQKKERLTEAEGSGNDEIVRYTLLKDMYDQRMNFIQEVKEKFGYELTLELNRDSATVYELQLTNQQKIDNIETDLLKGVNYGVQEPKEEKTENPDEGVEENV